MAIASEILWVGAMEKYKRKEIRTCFISCFLAYFLLAKKQRNFNTCLVHESLAKIKRYAVIAQTQQCSVVDMSLCQGLMNRMAFILQILVNYLITNRFQRTAKFSTGGHCSKSLSSFKGRLLLSSERVFFRESGITFKDMFLWHGYQLL